jgi:hypothetical protein
MDIPGPLESLWLEFAETCISPEVYGERLEKLKRCYYAGAFDTLRFIQSLEPRKIPDETVAEKTRVFQEDCYGFVKASFLEDI